MLHLPIRQKIIIMLAVMSGMLLSALDQTIVATALPRIVAELHGLNELSWVVTAYLLTSTIAVPISGKLSDLFGRKRLILIGITIFVVGSALSGLSQNMLELIIFRAFQGIGAGTLMSNSFAIIGDLFTPAERGRWQGLIGAVFGLSSVVGPLIGGYLTDHATWRWNFYINVPVGIVAYFMISSRMPKIEPSHKASIDFLGAGLLAGSLSALMLGLVWGGNTYPWLSGQVIGMFLLMALMLALFIRVEHKHADDPILPLDLFRNSIFSLSLFIVFLIGLAMFGAILYIPLFAQGVLGRTATNSGLITTPLVLSLVPSSIITGQIVSRTGKYKKIAVLGTVLTTAGILWLSTLTSSSTNSDLIRRMIVTGIGLGMGMPIFNLVVQNALPHKRLGIATASVQMFRSIGATVGVAAMGSIFNNRLAAHLADVSADPANHAAEGVISKNVNLSQLDSNHVQGLLSAQAQHATTAHIAQLPPDQHQTILTSYSHFILGLRESLSSSIAEVFLISGFIISLAFFAALLLREVPLRGHEREPLVSEGGVPGGRPGR